MTSPKVVIHRDGVFDVGDTANAGRIVGFDGFWWWWPRSAGNAPATSTRTLAEARAQIAAAATPTNGATP